jgi:MinD-like ATPase involved in chromosome partitioning or flagellar assembly
MTDSPLFNEVARDHHAPPVDPEPAPAIEPEPAATVEPQPPAEPAPAAPDFDDIEARAAKLLERVEIQRAPVPDPETSPPPDFDDVDARAARLVALMEARRAQQPEPEPAAPVAEEVAPAPEPTPVDVPAAPVEPVVEEPAVEQAPAPEPAGTPVAPPVADAPPPQYVPEPTPEQMAPPQPPPPQAPRPSAPPTEPAPPPRPPGPPPGWGALPPPPPPPGWPAGAPPWPVMPPPPPPGWRPPAAHASGNEPPHVAGYDSDEVRPPRHSAPPDYRPPQAYRVPTSLDEAEVFNRARHAPQSGWRRTLHKATGGRVNPGDSRKNREMEELLEQIRQPITGDFRVAVLSIKGGVGKTTTTLGLGSALAMVRTDRVIAVDANPDRGTLAERVRDYSTQSTVRDLLRDPNIRRYADVRAHTRMASSRLEVLASEQDPAVAEVFGEEDYRHTMDILRHYYNVILTDCGTGIMHSAMSGVLDLAHAIVLVSSPAIDAARSASATLDWLTQHGHGGLVREAHVVLSASRPGSAALKMDKVYEHFEARCQSIHMIPFDQHLAEGADIDFSLLKPATMQAYIELAGAVSEKFSRLRVSYDGR